MPENEQPQGNQEKTKGEKVSIEGLNAATAELAVRQAAVEADMRRLQRRTTIVEDALDLFMVNGHIPLERLLEWRKGRDDNRPLMADESAAPKLK
jgi:hypothetical protein